MSSIALACKTRPESGGASLKVPGLKGMKALLVSICPVPSIEPEVVVHRESIEPLVTL